MAGNRLLNGQTPNKRVTALDVVRDALRDAILRGDLPGDSRLIQTEIASELGVSTTPVREAMRELASDGLITLDNHRVGVVRRPDWHEMQEIVEMRRVLEPLAIARSMENITTEEIAKARELAESMASEVWDVGAWVRLNIEFHEVFHKATHSVRLGPALIALDTAAGIFAAQAQQLHPEVRERAIADHFALIEAYEAKDSVRALEIENEHVKLPLGASDLAAGKPAAAD